MYLGELGIIEGEAKRVLECYIDTRHFIRRKQYDEYTLGVQEVNVVFDVVDLMILAEKFKVTVTHNDVVLSELY